MITKNGAIVFSHRLYETSISGVGGLKNIEGTTITNNYLPALGTIRNNIFEATSVNTGVVMNLGSGTTAPTTDDYWLDTPLTSSDYRCDSPNPQISVTATADGQMIYTFTFYALTSFTVNEICISNINNAGKVMLARKVIPARQVTAGEHFTFSYAIKFN